MELVLAAVLFAALIGVGLWERHRGKGWRELAVSNAFGLGFVCYLAIGALVPGTGGTLLGFAFCALGGFVTLRHSRRELGQTHSVPALPPATVGETPTERMLRTMDHSDALDRRTQFRRRFSFAMLPSVALPIFLAAKYSSWVMAGSALFAVLLVAWMLYPTFAPELPTPFDDTVVDPSE